MFTFNIGGVPALKMIPLDELDSDTCYLSGDQSTVVCKDSDGNFAVFTLDPKGFELYQWNDSDSLLDNNPSCSIFFPSETVKISLRLEIMGGGV